MTTRRTALLAALALLLFAVATAGSAQNAPITFTVIGDVPYSSSEIPQFEDTVADHNVYSPSDFFVHVGDIKSGSSSCVESHYVTAADILHGLAVPAYIVPGDNEWNDCSDPDQAWAFWEEHLLGLEQDFCGVPADFEAQSVRPENFAFTSKGVLFIGLNLVGGSVHDSSEWTTRLNQNADFVNQQLAQHGAQVRAMVVFGQAGPSSNRATFFDRFVTAAAGFGKPVLYVHGDGHSWIQDRPFSLQSILRVQVPQGDPVEFDVSLDPVNPFTPDRDPWPGGTPVFNKPPCVEAEGDGAIDFGETASVVGLVTDDGDPDPPGQVDTTWSRASGPGTVNFASPGSVATTASFSAPGSYVLRLSADDGELATSDDVPVQVGSSGPLLSIDDLFVTEGDTAVFSVTLAGGTGGSVSVGWATADGSASSASDYTASSGTLSFSGATRSRTLSVPTTEDAAVEGSETFLVNLVNPSGANLAKAQGAAIVLDDDVPSPFTLSVATSGAGSVQLAPPGGSYAPGTVVTLTALPAPGSAFAGWSGELSGTANPATLTMSADRSVTASFVPVPTFTLTIATEGGGSVALSPPGGVYPQGSSVSLSALPDAGFIFAGWSGDLSGAANPASLVMSANLGVTAHFDPFVPPEVVVLAPDADAHVQSGGPGSNYGSADHLRAKSDSTTYRAYLRFDVPGFVTDVERATLRLRVTDASPSGGSVHAVPNAYAGTGTPWTESGLTWSNAPAISGAPLATAAGAVTGAWLELDVTGAVAAPGALCLGIQSLSDDSVRYSSKEGADPPQLVLELEPASAPLACSNGLDDDGDGLADFPGDPGCANAGDDSEHETGLPCDNGLDEDGDTLVDFPADPSCRSVLWISESGVPRCGVGFELALLVPVLRARRARILARMIRRALRPGM
jgi:hypothetical protein